MSAFWKGLAVAAIGLSAGMANAGGVNWSIGINLPPVSTVISNDSYHRPYYGPAPVYVAPPVVYQPAPVYHAPPPVYYRPVPIAVAPTYIVERRYAPPRHDWHHHRDHYRGDGHGYGHGHGRWHGRDHEDRGYHHRRGRD